MLKVMEAVDTYRRFLLDIEVSIIKHVTELNYWLRRRLVVPVAHALRVGFMKHLALNMLVIIEVHPRLAYSPYAHLDVNLLALVPIWMSLKCIEPAHSVIINPVHLNLYIVSFALLLDKIWQSAHDEWVLVQCLALAKIPAVLKVCLVIAMSTLERAIHSDHVMLKHIALAVPYTIALSPQMLVVDLVRPIASVDSNEATRVLLKLLLPSVPRLVTKLFGKHLTVAFSFVTEPIDSAIHHQPFIGIATAYEGMCVAPVDSSNSSVPEVGNEGAVGLQYLVLRRLVISSLERVHPHYPEAMWIQTSGCLCDLFWQAQTFLFHNDYAHSRFDLWVGSVFKDTPRARLLN